MMITLGTIGGTITATAEPDGWFLRSVDGAGLSTRERWPQSVLTTGEGLTAARQTEMLLDLEIAEVTGGAIRIPWDRFESVLAEDIQLPLRWTAWSPLMLSIDRKSELGRPDFRYRYTYRFGARETEVERVGYFVRRAATGQVFHLDEQTFALVDAMDAFNALPAEARTQQATWLTFARVKGCSATVGAALDNYLAENDVVVPSQIALDIYAHEDGSISFVPKAPGVSDDEFREAFLRNPDVEGLYVLDDGVGRRVRVVLSDRQRQVLERMTQVRHARGAAKEEACRNPAQFFDGLLDAVEIEYGSRVIGIGDLPFTSVPADVAEGGGFFKDVPAGDDGEAEGKHRGEGRPTAITMPAADGREEVHLRFRNEEELDHARAAMAAAIDRGDATVDLKGKSVVASAECLRALNERPVDLAPEDATERARGRRFLLCYMNDEELRTADAEAAAHASRRPVAWPDCAKLPASLKPGVALKRHQEESLLWLQRCAAITKRRGVLLADDMGLGKTLQILTFLASRIEDGRLSWAPDGDPHSPPWRPILIIAPLILVENETWIKEMRDFFAADGDIFQPVLVLHGPGIDAVRASGARGAETVAGRPMLSAERLMQYRTVITNYETVVNYQHSLAQKKDGRPLWSAIVTDEAQKYKAMSTKLSVALRAIDGDFHVASTGTPVENRLLDLWNIMDVVQPALLGTATDFSTRFEHRLAEDAAAVLGDLRRELLYGEPHAFLIRRTKDEILDLPEKSIERIPCDMSPVERGLHTSLLAVLSRERKLGRHLVVLHKLTRLYQHPALLRDDWERRDVRDLVAESTKLQRTLDKLHDIRRRGEKAIIFARHLDAQSLLQRVFEHEFDIRVPVINGSTSRGKGFSTSSSATARAKNERKRILDQFRAAPGFGLVILSPFVAGIGLTITEANHVIHYGRWWNPAVESQATDRAYRIGQSRPVHVWLPVLRDPSGHIAESFDECLDALLTRKTGLARDFLQPTEDEGDNANELCTRLEGDGSEALAGAPTAPFTPHDLDVLGPLEFEAAVAALYRADGYSVVLTAKGGDGGADVLAFRDGEARLVQIKHVSGRSPIDERALSDVLAARDVYGARLAAPWKATVVSNGSIAPSAIREAGRVGIEVVPGDRLHRRIAEKKIGMGAMAACAAARCANFEEGLRQARAYVGA